MSEEEIIDILQNVICDEVIGTYCLEIQKATNCSKNCENEDCYFIQAIEGIIDLYNKEKEKNKELTDEYLIQRDLINAEFLNENYISKDKIKEKIEELGKKEKEELKGTKGQDRYNIKQEFMFKKNILQELLEE